MGLLTLLGIKSRPRPDNTEPHDTETCNQSRSYELGYMTAETCIEILGIRHATFMHDCGAKDDKYDQGFKQALDDHINDHKRKEPHDTSNT